MPVAARTRRSILLAVVSAAALAVTSLTVEPSSAATGPSFVQQVSARKASGTSLTLTPGAAVTSGDRLIVGVGVWSAGNATASSVTDSAGNTYTELTHFKASDNTEMPVWTAPITAGGGTKPTITVKPTASADVGGRGGLEYAGLSTASGTGSLDVQAHATGNSNGAATVSSGPTPATSAGNELALGLFADSGFGDTLAAGNGYTTRVNVSPNGNMELLAEDQTVGQGATPAASSASTT